MTIVQTAPRISPRSDADATDALTAALEDEGECPHRRRRRAPGPPRTAHLEDGRTVDAARVLLASGRAPNVEELGLDRIGVRTHRGGIEVNERHADERGRASGPRAT